ncbi:hypothetical protein AAF712_016683 [Marasmius tenuissimus]|uniref:Uncharacterized protein n=1 Tax=Marasmius tenuissimus TaxID=585030 RepID=A0ABR2Z5X7_9AGAR
MAYLGRRPAVLSRSPSPTDLRPSDIWQASRAPTKLKTLSEPPGLPKLELVKLVLEQIECWPPNENGKRVTPTQIKRDTNVAELRRKLLSQECGFKTTKPHRTTTATMEPPPPPPQPLQPLTGSEETIHQPPKANSLAGNGYVFKNIKGQAGMIVVPSAVSPIDHKPFLALGADVLCEIQKTNAAIQGSEEVNVSQQFPENENYQVTFAKAFNPETPDYTVLTFTLLRLPSDGNIFLEVNINPLKDSTDRRSATHECGDEVKAENTKGQSKRAKKEVVAWLQEQLVERPGYEQFKSSTNRARTNPEIVEHWRFMYDVAKEYERQRPVVSEKRCRVTQLELAVALGYSPTTLKTAIAGYQIVKDHGRLSKNPIESIINEVERTHNPQKGATMLYKFLRASI